MIIYIDANGQQCDGLVNTVMGIEPLGQRIAAFGGQVQAVAGHDLDALAACGTAAHEGKPLFVIARTDPCCGVELLRQNAPKLHYLRFKSGQEKKAYQAILTGWNREDV
jgi:transketolase